MWKYNLEYAGASGKEYNIEIMERPNIPSPVIRDNEIQVPGCDGVLYSCEGTVEDIEIPVTMNFVVEPWEWFERTRTIKAWLLQKRGEKLRFEDDMEYFYRVKKVELSEFEREQRKIGRFTATFFCNGYHYLESGDREYIKEEVLYNPCCTSHPTYIIKGEGLCTLTVNGIAVKVNVGQNVTINTDRMITYREDKTMANTALAGDYEDLYLNPGSNEIEITKGFEMKIIPCWRCL